VFDLVVERTPFIMGMESLEQAISSFLHVCFVANMEYPKVFIFNLVGNFVEILNKMSARHFKRRYLLHGLNNMYVPLKGTVQ
jgi:hypothetical protein